MAGKGNSGVNGGQSGDLIIKLKIKEDQRFVRENFDISSTEYISITEAVLGCEIQAQTIDGPVAVRVPPGSSHGQRIKVQGRGVPKLPPNQAQRGDHYVQISVKIPKNLSREQERLFMQLRELEQSGTLGQQ